MSRNRNKSESGKSSHPIRKGLLAVLALGATVAVAIIWLGKVKSDEQPEGQQSSDTPRTPAPEGDTPNPAA